MFGQGQPTADTAVVGYISNGAATEVGNVLNAHMVLVSKATIQD